jgi:para-aminobenzoate synthetase
MRTLVIDNYDSFTYNLVHLVSVVNQEPPLVVRNDEIDWSGIQRLSFDNVMISPGPGHPGRAADFGICARLIAECPKPVLGVCLGHQGIATVFGGKVSRSLAPVHGKAIAVRHDGSALFHNIPTPFLAARYHSLLVEAPLPQELVETAWTKDGVIMALAHRTRPLWGIQFHPESVISEYGEILVRNFRDLTRNALPRTSNLAREIPAIVARDHPPPPLTAVWKSISQPPHAEDAFASLFGQETDAFWLDSSLAEKGRSRWSYFGASEDLAGGVCSYDCASGTTTFQGGASLEREPIRILDFLDRQLGAKVVNPPPCPFVGGWVGWLGYELGREFGGCTLQQSRTPDAHFLKVNRFIAVDHDSNTMYLVALAENENQQAAQAWIDETERRLAMVTPLGVVATSTAPHPIHFRLNQGRRTYVKNIEQCLEWIRAGETYQVCLTNEITAEAEIDSFDLYRTLRRINPAPHAAFIKWPGGAVLSASPERFFQVDASGHVEATPIKGTIRRHADAEQDSALAFELLTSEKNRAENVMIVDLLRNDLSRVCAPGSVTVPKLCDLESYETVHQLVSTVRGELSPGNSVIDLIRASFPGGSMTGAPKIRTLQLIDKIEGRPRGIYSGALGWIGHDGAADLSIVIRTIVQTGGLLSIGVGGGIVAESTPEGEFDEMLLKAKASIRAIVTAATGDFDETRLILEDAGNGAPLS